jgi:hypothetical protein
MKQQQTRIENECGPCLKRRSFLEVLPACAVTCLGLRSMSAFSQTSQAPAPNRHKFDEEIPRKLTFRQAMRMNVGDTIELMLFLSKTLGKEKAIALLKQYATETGIAGGHEAIKRLGKNDFEALKRIFSPESSQFRNTLTMQVVESTDRGHEIKVTECLWATTYREANASDEGYAGVCYGDYAFAKSFNPQIEMVRNKTLMQGETHCNHRYIFKA